MRLPRCPYWPGIGSGTFQAANSEWGSSANTVPAHPVATVEPLKVDEKTVVGMSREDVKVRQRRNAPTATDWIPAREERAALQLFILVDDTRSVT
jgi:hypothetical protein